MSTVINDDVGFHAGELAVQRRAGRLSEAARLEGMLAPANLSGGVARFLGARTFAALTARDSSNRLWISPLLGPEGFLEGSGTVLTAHTAPFPEDPLHGPAAGGPAGLIAVDFTLRRRVRVNGSLTSTSGREFSIDVEQAFGNCPSYIQRREVHLTQGRGARTPATRSRAAEAPDEAAARTLTDAEKAIVSSSDTFFLGTVHPGLGADASHKGGPPGFVRIDENGDLWWPDYAGNNMFNSLGNIAVNPEAALLFIDFSTGATVQLSGTAELEWTEIGIPGDDGETGRRVRFRTDRVTSAVRLPTTAGAPEPSPHNPRLH